MKKITTQFKWIPEFYFILVSVLWFYISLNGKNPENVTLINFPAIVLIVLFHIQLFLSDQALGKFLSYICFAASFYLIFTILFKSGMVLNFNIESQISLLKFGNIIILNFIMAFWMFQNYNSQKSSVTLNEIDH